MADAARSGRRVHLALLGFGGLSGLLYLVRPQLIVLPLLILPSLTCIVRWPARAWSAGVVGGAILALAAVGLEMAYTVGHLGVFRLTRYGLEAQQQFSWTAPGLAAVLWGERRGLLWFSPVVLLALLGFLLARHRELPWFARPLLLNALVQIYIVAGWFDFEQGDSFGMRMFCESAAVVAVGLALALRVLPRGGQIALGVGVAGSALWTAQLLVRYVYGAFR